MGNCCIHPRHPSEGFRHFSPTPAPSLASQSKQKPMLTKQEPEAAAVFSPPQSCDMSQIYSCKNIGRLQAKVNYAENPAVFAGGAFEQVEQGVEP